MDFEYFARVARVYETFEETRLLFNDGVTTGGMDSKSVRLVMGIGAEDRVGELYGRWQLNIISCILTAATVMSKVILVSVPTHIDQSPEFCHCSISSYECITVN